MNPLDLRGPEFLLFYGVLAAATIAAVIWWRRAADPRGPAPGRLTDAYRIAYLRGGRNEAIRVATLSLIDRGLLHAKGDLVVSTPDAARAVEHPLERAILASCTQRREARDLFSLDGPGAAAERERGPLEAQGLLPDAGTRRARRARALLAALLLGGVAFGKLAVALARGRSNVALLIIFAIIALSVLVKTANPRLTRRGAETLEDLRTLFAGLRGRVHRLVSGGATQEAALVSAVFGVGALAAAPPFAYAKDLFPRAAAPGVGGGTTVSSCGAACGSSGGSSCGGGGCGGGCGGCGG
jgi:uncharacterized protein (TIGR04222 family)